jgi:hypothetical protein
MSDEHEEPLDPVDLEHLRHDLELTRPRWWESGAIQAIPWVGPFIEAYRRETWEREAERFRALVEEATERASITPEDFLERMTREPHLHDAFTDAVQGALTTADERKIRALGRLLADGIHADDAQVDVLRIVIRELARLEVPHLRVLETLRNPPARDNEPPISAGTPLGASNLIEFYPGATNVMDALLTHLETAGLILNVDENAGIRTEARGRFVVTSLGNSLLNYLADDTAAT